MKKFLVISIILFVILLNFISGSVTNRLVPEDDKYFVKVDKKDLYIVEDDKWKDFNIVGVSLDPAKPGVFPSQNLVSEEEYYRWIEYIYEMGANCIQVPNLMSKHFYDALYKFNIDRKNPIYLMQGIYFDEVYLKDGYDPQSETVEEVFKTNIKLIVDSVHGNPYNFNKSDKAQHYKSDVSDYVLGYTLGIEFSNHDIIYTEMMNSSKTYNGEYIYTDKDSSSFEAYMARMGDELAKYEDDTYKKQSLISFVGSSSYQIVSARDNPKDDNIIDRTEDDDIKDYIDPENIKSKNKFKTGVVASYNIYPSYLEVKKYQGNMDYYFETINNYHTMPVIIGEYGIPSSRIAGDFNKDINKGYIDEIEQGKALVSVYNSIEKADMAGSFIFEFQDSWHKSAANTKELKIIGRSPYWSDAQTYSQGFGLMAFDPGKDISVSYPDDSITEWDESSLINQSGDMSLYSKSDEKYLYLMVKANKELDMKKQDIHIDLDITKNSGSNKSTQYGLEFEEGVDFIINIKDEKYSNIVVHDYYNTHEFIKNRKENKKRPDLMNKTSDMDLFSPIFSEIRPKMYVDYLDKLEDPIDYETGKLVYGNANPNNKDYKSSSDFYIGKDYVEIRIPWGLLNFMDPSTKQIQDDFYEKLHIEPMMINNIKIGATLKEDDKNISRLKSTKYDLDGWIEPTYHERLKESYYIVKERLTQNIDIN